MAWRFPAVENRGKELKVLPRTKYVEPIEGLLSAKGILFDVLKNFNVGSHLVASWRHGRKRNYALVPIRI